MNRTDLPSDPVQLCGFRQAHSEYLAAGHTSELSFWMVQLGMRPDLLVRSVGFF